jgi:6-phosphofructokinase 1
MKRLALLTSGGDAPGMNAAIRAATLLATAKGCEVYGIKSGYQGLIDGDIERIGPRDVAQIIREGGTMLGSARCMDFHQKKGRDKARAQLEQRGIDGLIVIGGNGSLTGMLHLIDANECRFELKAIGIPASIDNDLGFTRLSIGVDTAVNTIVEACDKISDTASAHNRAFIIEVMGRDCGYLAMTSAIASAADAVLFPESGKTDAQFVEQATRVILAAQQRKDRTKRCLIIKAEGVTISTEQLKAKVDERLKQELGAAGPRIETRVTVLGHVVRGGRPSAQDRLVASRLANAAVAGLLAGKTSKMAAWMPPPNLPKEIAETVTSDPMCGLVDVRAVLDETDAMLHGESAFVKWRRRIFEEIEDALAL